MNPYPLCLLCYAFVSALLCFCVCSATRVLCLICYLASVSLCLCVPVSLCSCVFLSLCLCVPVSLCPCLFVCLCVFCVSVSVIMSTFVSGFVSVLYHNWIILNTQSYIWDGWDWVELISAWGWRANKCPKPFGQVLDPSPPQRPNILHNNLKGDLEFLGSL